MSSSVYDDPSDDDLEACSQYYDQILNDTLPHMQAPKIALSKFGVVIDDYAVNRIMEAYACTVATLDDCVRGYLERNRLI